MKYGVWSTFSDSWCTGASLESDNTVGADRMFETDDINLAYRYCNIVNKHYSFLDPPYLVKERKQ